MRRKRIFSGWLLISMLIFSACANADKNTVPQAASEAVSTVEVTANETDKAVSAAAAVDGLACWHDHIPPYEGTPSVLVNSGIPFFAESDLSTDAFEEYSDLDETGRCGTAYANVCREIMPDQERGAIGNIRPTGWHTVKYDVIADRYLYNRCHLIGYCIFRPLRALCTEV